MTSTMPRWCVRICRGFDDLPEEGHAKPKFTIPLSALTRPAVQQLQGFVAIVVVPSIDFNSKQACIRLAKVFGLTGVYHLRP